MTPLRRTTKKSLASQTRPSKTTKRKSLSPQKLINTTKKVTDKERGTTKIPEATTTTKVAIIIRDANVTKEGKDVIEAIMMATVIIGNTNTRIINNLETVRSNLISEEREVVDKVVVGATEIRASAANREIYLTHVRNMTKA
jgi:ABC-type iron transport system FetAB permease component